MLYLPLDKLMDRSRDSDGNTVTVRPPVARRARSERRRRPTPEGGTLMGSRILGILVVVLALILLIASSTFVVGEQELAVRVRLSQIKGADFKPGLQFKIPFMDRVVKFDRRVLTRKFDGEQFLTSESQGLTIDYYIKWRILDAETVLPGDQRWRRRPRRDRWWATPSRTASRTPSRGRTLTEIVISDRQRDHRRVHEGRQPSSC